MRLKLVVNEPMLLQPTAKQMRVTDQSVLRSRAAARWAPSPSARHAQVTAGPTDEEGQGEAAAQCRGRLGWLPPSS